MMTTACLQTPCAPLELSGIIQDGVFTCLFPVGGPQIKRSSSTPLGNSGVSISIAQTPTGLSCRAIANKKSSIHLETALSYLNGKQTERLNQFLHDIGLTAKLQVLSAIVDPQSGANFFLKALESLNAEGKEMMRAHAASVGTFAQITVQGGHLLNSTDRYGRNVTDYSTTPTPPKMRARRPQNPAELKREDVSVQGN